MLSSIRLRIVTQCATLHHYRWCPSTELNRILSVFSAALSPHKLLEQDARLATSRTKSSIMFSLNVEESYSSSCECRESRTRYLLLKRQMLIQLSLTSIYVLSMRFERTQTSLKDWYPSQQVPTAYSFVA
jgi:hypothetical protein